MQTNSASHPKRSGWQTRSSPHRPNTISPSMHTGSAQTAPGSGHRSGGGRHTPDSHPPRQSSKRAEQVKKGRPLGLVRGSHTNDI